MKSIQLIELPYINELVTLYPFFRGLPFPILLDSNQPHFTDTEYDILVADPLCQISAKHDSHSAKIKWQGKELYALDNSLTIFDLLQSLINQTCAESWAQSATTSVPFTGGLMGYFGYNSGHFLETLPNTVIQDIALPDLQIGLYGWAIISLHKTQQTLLMVTPWCDKTVANHIHTLALAAINKLETENATAALKTSKAFTLTKAFSSNMTESQYRQKFDQVQDYINAGDCYQVNLAQRFSSSYTGDPFLAYQSLRKKSPTPFSAFLEIDNISSIMSHSPERFLLVNKGMVESKPIKGTRARGKDKKEDDTLAQELLDSPKDKAENLMIVDLLRNDLGKTCEVGSIKVPKLFALESFANVHHLVSTVTGSIKNRQQHFEVFKHSFPGGSITGAPKIRAMEIIDELEIHERSAYCGSIAYFSVNGQMDSSITIRTLVADNNSIHCWAGGGLVVDSNCQDEYLETYTKIRNLTNALETEFLSKALIDKELL